MLMALSFSFSAKAQFYLGGGIGGGYSSASDSYVVNVTPEFGYSFNKRWDLGLETGIGVTDGYAILSAVPYGRYNFAIAGPVKFFAEARLAFKSIDGSFLFGFGLCPGITTSLNKKFSLGIRLGEISYVTCEGFDNFTFNINAMSAQLGFYYHFK